MGSLFMQQQMVLLVGKTMILRKEKRCPVRLIIHVLLLTGNRKKTKETIFDNFFIL